MILPLPNGSAITGNLPDIIPVAIASFAIFNADGIVIEQPQLSTVRPWAVEVCQQWRGNQRAKIGLSAAAWQDLAYAGKAAHCRAWLADQSQPFGMVREAAVRGLTNSQMAQLIVAQNDAWLDANDQIDAAYTQVRAMVEAAQTVETVQAALLLLPE